MIKKLSKKDFKEFNSFCHLNNLYNNSKNRKRIFNNCTKRNDLCLIKKEHEEIKAVLFVYHKDNKKYVKVYSKDFKDTQALFQVLNWETMRDLEIVANKRDKHLIHYNKRTDKYYPSFSVKKARFYIKEDLGKKLLLVNKD